MIFQGTSASGHMIGELCGGNSSLVPMRIDGDSDNKIFTGHNEVQWIMAATDVLTVTMTSDSLLQDKGFLAEYYNCKWLKLHSQGHLFVSYMCQSCYYFSYMECVSHDCGGFVLCMHVIRLLKECLEHVSGLII